MKPVTAAPEPPSDRGGPLLASAVLAIAGWAVAAGGPGIGSTIGLAGAGLLTAGTIIGLVRRRPFPWLGWPVAGLGLAVLAVAAPTSPLEGLLAGLAGLAFLGWAVMTVPGRSGARGLLTGLALPGLAMGVGVGTALLLPSTDAQVGVAVLLALGVFGYLAWLLGRGTADLANEASPI